jgi:outer membrane lipoprotein LolB
VAASALRRGRIDVSRVALAFCVLLAGCAAPRVKTVAPDSAMLAKQAAREEALAAKADWQLAGRLGVSKGKDSGSGSLQWKQDGDAFRFSVHAPVTGKTWVLTGDPRHAVLEGLRDRPVEGDDAAVLLERELGWHVPVAELSAWVRGARASGDAKVEFREDGLPATIVQDGWTIEYPDYDTSATPPLPRKVFASRGEYRVRLAVSEWQ